MFHTIGEFCIVQNVIMEVKENHAIIAFNLSSSAILPLYYE